MSPKRKMAPVVHGELVAIRMPAKLRRAAERAAKADRRTFSDFVRLVLEDHLAGRRKGK